MLDTLFISAPEGASLPLSIDEVGHRLRERFPGMQTWMRHAPVSDKDYLDFDVVLTGTRRSGAYHEGGPLVLNDGDEAEWVPTIAWFLSLLPRGTPVVTMRETNPGAIVALPHDADAAQIQGVLADLAAD
jgi:hypothetical protein